MAKIQDKQIKEYQEKEIQTDEQIKPNIIHNQRSEIEQQTDVLEAESIPLVTNVKQFGEIDIQTEEFIKEQDVSITEEIVKCDFEQQTDDQINMTKIQDKYIKEYQEMEIQTDEQIKPQIIQNQRREIEQQTDVQEAESIPLVSNVKQFAEINIQTEEFIKEQDVQITEKIVKNDFEQQTDDYINITKIQDKQSIEYKEMVIQSDENLEPNIIQIQFREIELQTDDQETESIPFASERKLFSEIDVQTEELIQEQVVLRTDSIIKSDAEQQTDQLAISRKNQDQQIIEFQEIETQTDYEIKRKIISVEDREIQLQTDDLENESSHFITDITKFADQYIQTEQLEKKSEVPINSQQQFIIFEQEIPDLINKNSKYESKIQQENEIDMNQKEKITQNTSVDSSPINQIAHAQINKKQQIAGTTGQNTQDAISDQRTNINRQKGNFSPGLDIVFEDEFQETIQTKKASPKISRLQQFIPVNDLQKCKSELQQKQQIISHLHGVIMFQEIQLKKMNALLIEAGEALS